ncbi:MAG: hypothetical protein AAAC47_18925 [Pararhizobium sp.]
MPEFSAIASNVCLSSSDLDLLRAVLDDWCDSNGVTVSDDVAKAKATALIDWFQFGIQSPTELKALLLPLAME